MVGRAHVALAFLLAVFSTWAQPAVAADNYVKGQFLVATEHMRDPRFAHAVILMIEHDAKGAFGVIVNKPIGKGPLSRFLDGIGADPVKTDKQITLFYGGPVQLDTGSMLHTNEYERRDTKEIGSGVSITRTPRLLVDFARGRGPQRMKVVMGYAGWGPGQLDAEISHGDWTSAPVDPDMVFEEETDGMWSKAAKGSGVPL